MAANPFSGWLAEVAADAVVIRPDDLEAEARGNMWSFSLSSEQAAAVTVAEIEAFANGVADARRVWLSARRAGPMELYWWHDAQAGQLRFSLVPVAHGRLPFGCEVVPSASLSAVVSAWLGAPHLHGRPPAECRSLGTSEADTEPPRWVLPVWSLRVP